MKRALCLLLICLFCTGCSALPPEERAFCVALSRLKLNLGANTR